MDVRLRREQEEHARAIIKCVALQFSVFGKVRLELDTLVDDIVVGVWMQVPDRRQPPDAQAVKIIVVSVTRYISFDEMHRAGWSLDYFADRVRRYVHEFVMHEVDEMLMVDGVRLFDPHADEHRAHARRLAEHRGRGR